MPSGFLQNRVWLDHPHSARGVHDAEDPAFLECLQNDRARHSILGEGHSIRNVASGARATTVGLRAFARTIISRRCAFDRFSRLPRLVSAVVLAARPRSSAQAAPADTTPRAPDPTPQPHYKLRFAAGFISSILAHESGHIIASYAVGGTSLVRLRSLASDGLLGNRLATRPAQAVHLLERRASRSRRCSMRRYSICRTRRGASLARSSAGFSPADSAPCSSTLPSAATAA